MRGVSFVAKSCKILIADRNRHVRDFLRRELSAEGYEVEVARDGREVLSRINGDAPPHLVIHTFLPEYPTNLTLPIAAAFLEKKGDTDLLKTVVAEVIEKHYPEGVPVREKTG